MAIKQAKYKIINADSTVDIYHFQTNADLVVEGSTYQVPTKTNINAWNSVSYGGVNTFIGSSTPTTGVKANDIWFKLL